jgi:hypothetical protein
MSSAGRAAAGLLVAGLISGCSSPSTPAAPASPPASGARLAARQATEPAPVDGRGGHGGGAGGAARPAAARLPAGFPSGLPVPVGVLQSSAGAAGRWSLAILAAGSAPAVKRAAVDLYSGHGFSTSSPDSIPVTLVSAAYTITLLVENHDHSASQTTLVLSITRN